MTDLKLKLICKRQRDGRQYNLPSASEVVALIVGDFDPDNDHHDIVIQHNSGVWKGLVNCIQVLW